MWAANRVSASGSIGESTATRIARSPSAERDRPPQLLSPARRAETRRRPPSQYSTAATATKPSGGLTGQAAALVRLGIYRR